MPYVAVNEARQTLLPRGFDEATLAGLPASMKSFDFVVYGPERNLLVDVKGRALGRLGAQPLACGGGAGLGASGLGGVGVGGAGLGGAGLAGAGLAGAGSGAHRHRRTRGTRPRLECWATQRDLDDLLRWEALFGEGFEAALVFVYASEEQPPDGLFSRLFGFEDRWYGMRAITVADFARSAKQRSQSWGTVDLPAHVFEGLSEPFSPRYLGADVPEAAYR